MNHFHQTAPCLLRVVSRFAERLFRPSVLELFALVALPAAADNINPAVTNGIPPKSRLETVNLLCSPCFCAEGTFVTNGCVTFAVSFGRSPLVAADLPDPVRNGDAVLLELDFGAETVRAFLRAMPAFAIDDGNVVYRGGFNLHTGRASNGCVTVWSDVDDNDETYPHSDDYDKLKALLNKTTPLEYKPNDFYSGYLEAK